MRGKLVTVFGGSGFLGRYVVQALAKEGARIRVAVRNPQNAEYLRSRGNVGDIMPIYANTGDPLTVGAACLNADYILNLTGILYETGKQTFEDVHIRGAANVAEAAKRHKAKRFLHISAIGADPGSDSAYASSKGKGETAILAHFDKATILRPSVVFGEDDHFINRFAEMARLFPTLPVFGKGEAKLQPVFCNDVAKAIITCLKNKSTEGKVIELGGPKIYTFKEILQFILKTTNRKRWIVDLPYWFGSALGSVTQVFAPSLLTADQVKLLQKDNVVSNKTLKLKDLGISPEALEAIAPHYLERFKPTV